jgi:CRP-like cAMP-binding protein
MDGTINTAPHRGEKRDQRLIEGVIANLALFRELPPVQLATLAAQSWILTMRRFEIVAGRGTCLPGVLAVAYGTLDLSLRGPDNVQRVLRLVGAGQTFGEAAALLGRASPYEARALSEAKLVVVPSAAIFAVVERDPRFARTLLLTLAERKLELLAEFESSTMRRGAQRLAHYLASLAAESDRGPACTVRLPASKTLIASRLDMKKETLSRLLRSLAERGLISMAQREITIHDRGRLAELVGVAA